MNNNLSRKAEITNKLSPVKNIESLIIIIRGQKVLLDSILASIYGVETKRLNEQVRRNINRFPEEFMFQLTKDEFDSLRSQFATIESGRGKHRKYLPYAFSEYGALMAANILNSEVAIQASIMIIKAFVRIKEVFLTHKDILAKISELEKRADNHDETIIDIIQALKKLIPVYSDKPKIGFSPKT